MPTIKVPEVTPIPAQAGNLAHMSREGIRRVMHTRVPTVRKNSRVKDAAALLKQKARHFDTLDYIYVVDKSKRLVGVLSIKDVFNFPPSTRVEDIMTTQLIFVHADADPEVVAHLSLKHRIKAIPVVDAGKLVGVVSHDDVLHILNRALRRDFFHFAGIQGLHLEYENTMTVPLLKSIEHRTPWLIFGLAGIILTAAFIGIFEEILQEYLILAFFIPAIVYMSGALGMQVQTLFVRDLAVMGKDLNPHKYLTRQISISSMIALIVGFFMFCSISLFWHEPYLAFVIALSSICTITLTSFTAFIITLTLAKSGYDPALGGGPFATVISDATSIILYFAIATLLL